MKSRDFIVKTITGATLFILCCYIYNWNCSGDKIKVKTAHDYAGKFAEALIYCKQHHLNIKMFMLIDLSVHSGKKRMFLMDLQKREITKSYMVSHGCGVYPWSFTFTKANPRISNELSSHCSSVGKYVIGEKGKSQWGIKTKYMLLGMDSSNSNAIQRSIVLHSWNAVQEEEVYPSGTPEGWGCPAVSNASMREISNIIDHSERKMLLWIIK